MAILEKRGHLTASVMPGRPSIDWANTRNEHGAEPGRSSDKALRVAIRRSASPKTLVQGSSNDLSTESDRTKVAYENYKQLVARAVDVFGDEIAASIWLSTPNPDFGGNAPLQVAQEHGYNPETLEPVLIRIEHGVTFDPREPPLGSKAASWPYWPNTLPSRSKAVRQPKWHRCRKEAGAMEPA